MFNSVVKELKDLRGSKVYYWGSYHTMPENVSPFLIDTLDILNALSDYEINQTIEEIEEMEMLKEIKVNNTYNWNAPVSNDFVFRMYESDNGNYYVELAVHLYGDVRGNYSDDIVYKFDNDWDFFETLYDCNAYKEVEVNGKVYGVDINTMYEGLTVYDENGDEIGSIYGYYENEEECAEDILELLNQ